MENGKWKMVRFEPPSSTTRRIPDPPSICHLSFTICNARARRRCRAFTLVQMLVVIGIIVTLMALALPAILKAYGFGIRTRTLSDLQLISTALEAYKQDFGDYPRIDNDNTPGQLNWLPDRGARL